MEWDAVPDARPRDGAVAVEGHAWCPACRRQTGYTMSKVEFLGNPIKASFFCAECGGRMHPEASDQATAIRLQASARRLRLGAAGSFLLMLLLPLLLLGLVIYFIVRLL